MQQYCHSGRRQSVLFHRWTVFGLLCLIGVTSVCVAAVGATGESESPSATPAVDSGVTAALAKGRVPDVIVRFRDRADLIADSLDYRSRGRYVYETLKAHAEQSQALVRQQLEQRHGRRQAERGYTVLWIDNSLFVPAVDVDVLDMLRRSAEVESIRLDQALPVPFEPLVPIEADAGTREAGTNIARIKAPEVWAQGYRGEGLVVANIDSGVRYTHQTLVNQYRGNTGSGFDHDYDWYDPYEHSPVPRRNGAHGTHTMGTIVGDDGAGNEIGVAPGAKWIACVGSALDGNLYLSGLIECGQFMLAPTDTDGNDPNPDLRPAVVNNSWSGCGTIYDDFYEGVIDAWIAAGIVPVFSNGNNTNCGLPAPPGLNTVASPGRSGKVLGIGSTGNNNGQYAPHSLWGPTDNPNPGWPAYPDHRGFADLKPNVSAPGALVRSALDGSDSAYGSGTGTSMSAPHVAGLVALMWQAAPCLIGDYPTTGSLIMEAANAVPYVSGSPSDGPGNVPNQATGWGEIDALAAVTTAIAACGPHGSATGAVTDSENGTAIANVRLIFDGPRDYQLVTDASGVFGRELAAGEYSLTVDVFGYHPVSQSVTITADQTTTLNIELDPTERHTVSGVVTDSVTGWPLHARLHIVQPGGSTQAWTHPETGAYAIALPAGHTYTFTTSASVPGYFPASVEVSDLNSNAAEDFALDANTITCAAPGYAGSGGLYESFQDGSLPDGWTAITDRPSQQGWTVGEDLGSEHFVIPSHGTYAASNDDAQPITSVARQERLIAPPAMIEADGQLRYASAYSGGFGLQANVEVSTDGENWTSIAVPVPTGSGDAPQWRHETVDLSGYVGQTIRIAFRTDDGGDWSSGWAIDDVHVSPPCDEPPPGALVIGKVIDGDLEPGGLNGASVSIAGSVTTTAASEDPAIGDGWYALYVPTGQQTVVASLTPYPELQLDIDVPVGGALRVDLDLAKGDDAIFRNGFEDEGGEK